MHVFVDNIDWMLVNTFLALVPAYAGWLFVAFRHIALKVFFGAVWLFFVPNTVYILTDLIHVPRQIHMTSGYGLLLLLVQYCIFLFVGVLSFLVAMRPIHGSLKKRLRAQSTLIIVALNFLIAFGVTMGRFQRTNSWEVISNSDRVVADSIAVLRSTELLVFVFFFGLLTNGIYFFFHGYNGAFVPTKQTAKRKK